MKPPCARGSLSDALTTLLLGRLHDRVVMPTDPDDDEDAAITLWTLQELHYRGFDAVDERWEWHPDLARVRWCLQRGLEERLRARRPEAPAAGDVVENLLVLLDADDSPSLARHIQQHGTREQALALLRQRSIYHLKEADPTSWVVPRLAARPKAALMEVLFDEYGVGDPARLHHHLFERGLAACGLSPDYGAYIDEATCPVVEQNVVVTMLGLNRRLRGAALGHFAAFEATSSLPARQLAQGLERLQLPEEIVSYYDEHVEADAVHEQLALRAVCGTLVEEEPGLHDDVLFGAWLCLDLEARTAATILAGWAA